MIRRLMFIAFFLLSACANQVSKNESGHGVRKPSSEMTCDEFNALPAKTKQEIIFQRHLESARNQYAIGSYELLETTQGPLDYVYEFLGNAANRAHHFAEASAATAIFLSPGSAESHGFKSLGSTLTRSCDFFPDAQAKKVHALGTMASAHLKLYDRVVSVTADGEIGKKEFDNPWSGLFDVKANGGSVPMFVRFSIANPIGLSIPVVIPVGLESVPTGYTLGLEFIPGLGMKFLVDGQKSVDLVAMESLAGQGDDQNFFKYEFSPDFSAHAPENYNTATGSEKKEILARYNRNPVNHLVMNLVGKRFTQAIPYAVKEIKAESIQPHSSEGPHGFIMSIQDLAAVDRTGRQVAAAAQKRPWRLVFRPAIDYRTSQRYAVTDPDPYNPSILGTVEKAFSDYQDDFRYKLAHLTPGDRIYYVEGETKPVKGDPKTVKRYRLGEIILDSRPFPSLFADKEFFIQHKIEVNRMPGNTQAIVEPK